MELSPFQRQTFKVDAVSQLYPEYYILKVNGFDQVAKSPLEEWIHYLNTGKIPETYHAPGLDAARERLKIDSMSKDEKNAYYRHMDNINLLKSNIKTEREEGKLEGLQEGLQKGRAEGGREKALSIARKLKTAGMDETQIAEITGLKEEEIRELS